MPPRADPSAAGTARLLPKPAARLHGGLLSLLAALLVFAPSTAAQTAPDADWRTLHTAHFRVNYMAGLDSLARGTAARAEWAYDLLSREFTEPPAGKIEIILADNVDFANGSATPFPTNRILLYAHPPTDVAELAFTTDWLELLVLHELVHIFHLDQAGGVWEALRSVLGRNAALFPQVLAPSWMHEGLATYYESALTPGGRVRGTLFEMALRTAVLEDALFPIDRVTGDPRRWPGGSSRYVYGSLFLDFLARRHGPDRLPRLIERYGRQIIPYWLNGASQEVIGSSLTAEWGVWADSLRSRYKGEARELRAAGLTEPEMLTAAGRDAYHPRYSPDGGTIAYVAATGGTQPSIRLLDVAERTEVDLAPLARLGPLSWARDGRAVIYGELEYRGPYRLLSDLRVAGLRGGGSRLTRGARVGEPDLHPDGRTVVAVGDAGGSNVLLVGDPLGEGMRPLVAPEAEVHWGHPRWSPDGSMVAAVRWTPGGMHDVVLLDRQGRLLREVTRDRAIDAAPTWAPDGRRLVFWSDRTGIPNLFAFDLQEERLYQVTRVLTGAIDPDVSPDGRWLAFAWYRADGYHIARIPMDPSTWQLAPPARPEAAPLGAPRVHAAVAGDVRPYSSWPSVKPATWTLQTSAGTGLGFGAGVILAGVDAIERHRWAVDALVHPEGWRLDGGAIYRYLGLGNPAVEVAVSQEWRDLCDGDLEGCSPVPTAPLRREREAELSLLWVRQRVRSTSWLRPGISLEKRDYQWAEPELAGDATFAPTAPDAGLLLEAGRSTVRSFALSLGPQVGYSLVSRAEGHRFTRELAPGADRGYLRLTERARGYQPLPLGATPHVLAVRGDVGIDLGDRSPGFDVGGASGGGLPIALDVDLLGGGLSFPIRGYPQGVQRGNRALSASAEYRFPLVTVERGMGLIPFYLDRLSGDLFADVGTAWCDGICRFAEEGTDPDPLASVGAELLAEMKVGFFSPLPLRLGIAFPLREGGEPEVHLRVGRGF